MWGSTRIKPISQSPYKNQYQPHEKCGGLYGYIYIADNGILDGD
jgi:hypothetical protein